MLLRAFPCWDCRVGVCPVLRLLSCPACVLMCWLQYKTQTQDYHSARHFYIICPTSTQPGSWGGLIWLWRHFYVKCSQWSAKVWFLFAVYTCTTHTGILAGGWPCGTITVIGEYFGSESLSQVYGFLHTFMFENHETLLSIIRNHVTEEPVYDNLVMLCSITVCEGVHGVRLLL